MAFLFMILFFTTGHLITEPDTSAGVKGGEMYFQPIGGNFNRISAIGATPHGELFIVETGRHRIVKLDDTGIRLDSLGSRGSGDYRFDRPADIDATNGMRIYVADRNNNRIQVFDRRLQFLSSVKAPDRPGFSELRFTPEMVSVNKFGDLFVFDADQERVLKYDQQGRFELDFSLRGHDIELPVTAMTHYEDLLFIAERTRGIVHILTSGGGYRSFSGGLGEVNGMFTSENNIWVVTAEEIIRMDFRGRVVQRSRHNITETPTGIAARGRHVFVTTENRLFIAQK